ncbi:endoribonuclease Dicer homolog 1-like [Castanea sativa]|uniref:endoribonuclease Dicer homolog 1-like n=1 Tax=Castanea sativa TaxID=21020 RepID=UPI003F64E2F1
MQHAYATHDMIYSGVSSQVDCAIKIRNLESKLDSIVCTIKDRKELEKHVPMPSEVVVEYDKAASLWSLHEQIKQMEAEVEEAAKSSCRRSKWQFMGARDARAEEELRQVYGVSERTECDGAANLIQKSRAINYALGELGQWCAYKVAQSFLTALQNDERANYQLDVKFQESYLNKVVSLLQCQLSEGAVSDEDTKAEDLESGVAQNGTDADEIEEGELPDSHVVSGGEHVDVIIGAAVADGKVKPKVQSLIKILLKYQQTEDFRAIIFVERVVSALVLPKVFAELPSLSFIKCASLIGHNNSHEMWTCQMQDTIAKFRDGRVTLLVATSVAEEGLDIRQCNVVIRFDLAKTVLAYIQSRGRARKPGSDYILMVSRGNLSHEAFLRNARNSEEILRKEAIERTDLSHIKDISRLISVDSSPGTIYQVESTGAVVSLNSSVGLVHFYCSQLPSDRYSILRPEFIMEKHEKPGGPTEYSCKLQLPCNAPFEKLEGPVCSSMRLAQQAVCLAACKKLHEMGAFTDMLLPDKGSGEEREKVDQNDEGDPLPGTARHREFYPEGVADVLKFALGKGLQSYIQADRFAPSRWAAPGVLTVFDEDTKDGESSLFDQDGSLTETERGVDQCIDGYENDEMEDGELEGDSSSYRVLSSKTLADVVEALIGVYYVEGGKVSANHLMKWIGIQVEFDADEMECISRPSDVPESILRSINFDALEGALNIKFNDRGLLVEAITHASRPSSGVACYQRLEFVGDAVLDHLITRHLFFTYTDLPPGCLTDLRAAAVNNENFARVAVKHNLHVHLRHGSSALEKQIWDFVKEVQDELLKPGFNSFGLSDCKAPKVLGDIVESIAGAIFLDSGRETSVVWKVFQPLLQPMVTPETLPMHPVRELQERCQQQAEGLEYKASRSGNVATVEVFIDGVQIGIAQNPQKKMAQKLAARNALAALKEKETAEAKENDDENGKKKKNGSQTFTRQTLNDICLRRNWPMPFYRCVNEGGPAHAKRFTFAVRVNTADRGWTDECVGNPMPSVKKAKDSVAVLLLELINRLYS